jgi:hypothetical protein
MAARIKREKDMHGVWVPKRSTTAPCQWTYKGAKTVLQWIPFEVMLDIMEFVLDNAFVQMRDGKILRQNKKGYLWEVL